MTANGRPSAPREPLDDAGIAQLVHDVADGWTMPPQRLDAPSWRDRVRSPGARRLSSLGGWFARVGQAATAAIALTVVGALLAVMITQPQVPGATSSPGATDVPPRASDAPLSLLPLRELNGEPPDPSVVLVQQEVDFALVKLVDGAVGNRITGKDYGSKVRVLADGTIVCLCLKESAIVDESPTQVEVTFDRFDAGGQRLSSVAIETMTGAPDPRDVGTFVPERPPHVQTAMTFSADDRHGFVGWAFRAGTAWRSGITVVDLRDGSIVSRPELPTASTGEGDARRVVDAPRVVGAAGADRLIIARGGYEWSPAASTEPDYRFESDLFRARFVDGQLADAALIPLAAEECGRNVQRAGALPDGGTWLSCTSATSPTTVVRRLAADGSVLSDHRVPADEGIDGETTALSPDGSTLFVWDPTTATITRFDLATGDQDSANGLSASAEDGLLAALGRWLAPTAAAKTFLRGAVVVSPDGTRVYAIGVKAAVGGSEQMGSAGVFVFDAVSLETLAIWQPKADFVSLALSADGRFAYAAGLPGFDEVGRPQRLQKASITVYDTSDGSVRLIAGALGLDAITFATPILD